MGDASVNNSLNYALKDDIPARPEPTWQKCPYCDTAHQRVKQVCDMCEKFMANTTEWAKIYKHVSAVQRHLNNFGNRAERPFTLKELKLLGIMELPFEG